MTDITTRLDGCAGVYECERVETVTPSMPRSYEQGFRDGEQRAVEGICKRLRYWQKELNAAFDYAADIENGGWKETP